MKPDEEAPGWVAIDSALAKVYPGQTAEHFAPETPPSLGGTFPFEGVSIYQGNASPEHWHAVTYGLTELFEKTSNDEEFSGYGFEFTVRIPKSHGEQAITMINRLLTPLGQYVRQTGNPFAHGHRIAMDLQSSLPETSLGALAFCLDPELGSIDTVHGRVDFLQVVGITDDELTCIRDASPGTASTECLFRVLRHENPLLVMDLDRASILGDSRLRAELESCLDGLAGE